MKTLLWMVFLLLTAFWTGLVALTEQLSQWLLASMAGGQISELATLAGQWPVPAWLGFGIDTAWLTSLQASAVALMQWLGQVMPSSPSLMQWLTPLLWLAWALGAAFLLLCAVLGHWVLGQRGASRRQGLQS